MALLIVGFGFKVAAVPFHVWAPDVYEGAPTTITAFMAVGVKAAAFAAFLVFSYCRWVSPRVMALDFLGVGGITMTVGNLTALVQDNIKRMLAYSSIAHAGYLLVAMVAGSETGGAADVLPRRLWAHELGAFAVMVAVRESEPNEEFDDYAGFGFRYPGLAMI